MISMSLSPQQTHQTSPEFHEMWERISPHIQHLLKYGTKGWPMTLYNKIFTDSFEYNHNITRTDQKNEFPEHLSQLIKSYLEEVAEQLRPLHGADFLLLYQQQWEHYAKTTKVLTHLFKDLDLPSGNHQPNSRDYISSDPDFGVRRLCYILWQDIILSTESTLRYSLKEALLHHTQQQRERDKRILEKNCGFHVGDVSMNEDQDENSWNSAEKAVLVIIQSLVTLEADEANMRTEQGESSSDQILKLYKDIFETPFLVETERVFTQEADYLLESVPIPRYLIWVEGRLQAEKTRAESGFIHIDSQPSLERVCQKVFLSPNRDRLENEFRRLVAEEHLEDASRLVKLLANTLRSREILWRDFQIHVQNYGGAKLLSLSKETNNDLDTLAHRYTETLVELRTKFQQQVSKYLGASLSENITGFEASLAKASRFIINNNPVCQKDITTGDLFSRKADSLLKSAAASTNQAPVTTTTTSIQTIEKDIDNLADLLMFVEDKDIFVFHFKKATAKRFLSDLVPISYEHEARFLSHLKRLFGTEHTSHLQTMFTENERNKDLRDKFRAYLAKQSKPLSMDMSCKVVSSGAWPLTPLQDQQNFIIPVELIEPMTIFKNWYVQEHERRVLTFLPQYSRFEISFTPSQGSNGSFFLHCAEDYVAAVLLYFNVGRDVKFDELLTNTQISEQFVRGIIKGLLKSGVIKLVDPSRTVLDKTTILQVDDTFNSPRRRIPVRREINTQPLSLSDSLKCPNSPAPNSQEVENERKTKTQAALVRIMKLHKRLTWDELFKKVEIEVRGAFVPRVTFVKQMLQFLIEREYIEKENSPDEIYLYRA
jgi:hypothetical protein